MAKKVIALGGPKYSGKDSIAEVLQGIHKDGIWLYERTPMAAGVKQICSEVFGWPLSLMEDPLLKETPTEEWPYIAPREPMMDVANWFRDRFGGDVWVRRNQMVIAALASPVCVVTDWRFPEETEWLNSLGNNALKIYVQRDSAEESLLSKQAAGDSMANNPSESHYASIKENADYIIENNSELGIAQMRLMNLVETHFGISSIFDVA